MNNTINISAGKSGNCLFDILFSSIITFSVKLYIQNSHFAQTSSDDTYTKMRGKHN